MPSASLHFYDPARGDAAFAIDDVSFPAAKGSTTDIATSDSATDTAADTDVIADGSTDRSNCFTVFWVQAGDGEFQAGSARYTFRTGDLLAFVPYQPFALHPASEVQALRLRFHANFFCIEAHHEAVGCNGVLFNDVYDAPVVTIAPPVDDELRDLAGRMQQELRDSGLAHAELLVSYLKVFLIKATRLKIEQRGIDPTRPDWQPQWPQALRDLKRLIEEHYREKHRPGDYAGLLHLTPKALGKLCRTYFRRSPTELIRERILLHARWELLHTRKPVQAIARELGFADELYFSRMFKQATGFAPAIFRQRELEIRSVGNQSMN